MAPCTARQRLSCNQQAALMSDPSQLEADCLRYYLHRVFALDCPIPEDLRVEIVTALAVHDFSSHHEQVLHDRDRSIKSLQTMLAPKSKWIAVLENFLVMVVGTGIATPQLEWAVYSGNDSPEEQ